MAFVFRSQKKSIFEDRIFASQNQSQPSLAIKDQNETKLQERSIDLSKVLKGLPSSNQKLRKNGEIKQYVTSLPQFQVNLIHKTQSNLTLKHILYFKKTQSKLNRDQKQNSKLLNKFFQAQKSNKSHKSSLILSSTIKPVRSSKLQEKTLQSQIKIQKEKRRIYYTKSEPNILNKNLLKTLSLIRSRQNTQSFKQINMISQKHSRPALDSKNAKTFNFQSMKKLSPIKFQPNQNCSKNAINLLLSNKTLSKIEGEVQFNQSKKQTKKLLKPLQQRQEINQGQEEQQFEQGANPGPGAYNLENWNKKKQFRSKKQKFGKIFYSQLERFQSPPKINQVTLVKEQVNQIEKYPTKNTFTSFLSKSPRFDKQKSRQIPPPGYYNTRQTLQYDLIKNILKGSNSDTLINTEDRHSIITKKKEALPGPGSYNVDSFVDKVIQQQGVLTSSYKSKLTRNLHSEHKEIAKKDDKSDSILQKNENDKFNPIHVQDASMLPEDYQIEVPPFLSSSQRFPTLKPIFKESFCKKKAQVPIKKQQTKQAFNSSQKRKLQNKIGLGVGVGIYNITKKQIWNKKSHNILFN